LNPPLSPHSRVGRGGVNSGLTKHRKGVVT
jgi:hypothetical protein